MILELIPQKDRVSQRLVSKEWCKSVDEWSSFKIVYNDVPESLRRHVFNLRIRACEFSGLKNEIELEFSQPLLLKEITFGPCVSPENSKKILSQCKNVEYLKFFATEKSDTYFQDSLINPVEYLKNLKMLRSIDIGMLYFGRRDRGAISPTFATLIGSKNLVFPALSEIIIQCNMTRKEWFELMQFLGRHVKTLRGISLLQCICDAVSLPGEEGAVEDEPVIEKISASNLTSFVIMKGSTCNCNGEFLWSKLLNARSGVQKLWTNLVPSTSVISEFVGNNHSTLRTLKLYDISLGIDATMDASVFQHCAQLEELSLHFLSCAVIVIKVKEIGSHESPITKRYSEMYGLQFLPKSLKRLSITGCDIMSSTIMDMSWKLTDLLELHFGDPGSSSRSDYGATIQVLCSLIKNMRGLKKLRIHENSINKSEINNTDWEKVNQVFHNYNLTDGPQIENGSAQTRWMGNCEVSNSLIDLNFSAFCGDCDDLLDRLQSELSNSANV